MNTSRVISGGLLLSVLIPSALLAADFRAAETPQVAKEEVVNDDVYLAGGSISSLGDVRGDLISVGGSMVLSGAVLHDLMAAGGNVSITSSVGDDLRVAGGNVTVQGSVAGDVVAAGGQLQFSGTGIGGDAALAGGTISIDTPIAGDLRVGGGSVRINAPVGGSIYAEVDSLTLGPKAVVTGNLNYRSPNEAKLEQGAAVQGKTEYAHRETPANVSKAGIATFLTFWFFMRFLMLLAGSLALGLLFRRYAHELTTMAAQRPLAEIGLGLVTLIVVPIVSVLLLATVIGIPLGMLGLIAFAGILVFTSLVAPIITGSLAYAALTKASHYTVDWKTILLGAVIYFLIGYVPFIGWAAKLVLMVLSIGAMMHLKWGIAREWR